MEISNKIMIGQEAIKLGFADDIGSPFSYLKFIYPHYKLILYGLESK